MTDHYYERLFAGITAFGWDARKRAINRRVHGIDFGDAIGVFDGPVVIVRSDRYGEARYKVVGTIEERVIAVICVLQGAGDEHCRIVSARPASRSERRALRDRAAR